MNDGARCAEADVACGHWRPYHARLPSKIAFSIQLLLLVPTIEIFFYPPDLQLLAFIAEERAIAAGKVFSALASLRRSAEFFLLSKIYMSRGVITVIFIHIFTVVMRSGGQWYTL